MYLDPIKKILRKNKPNTVVKLHIAQYDEFGLFSGISSNMTFTINENKSFTYSNGEQFKSTDQLSKIMLASITVKVLDIKKA